MHLMIHCLALCLALCWPLAAEQVMHITLSSTASDERLATLTKVIFSDDSLRAGASYDLDDIRRIEFYDDATSVAQSPGIATQSAPAPRQARPCFAVCDKVLAIALPASAHVRVCVFGMDGSKLGEVYNGVASAGTLRLPLGGVVSAAGAYTVLLRSDNDLYYRTIILK